MRLILLQIRFIRLVLQLLQTPTFQESIISHPSSHFNLIEISQQSQTSTHFAKQYSIYQQKCSATHHEQPNTKCKPNKLIPNYKYFFILSLIPSNHSITSPILPLLKNNKIKTIGNITIHINTNQ